ncbi:MAG TPA: DnaJ C-terminal domain-containing protein, partial [Nitrospira sp.]
QSVTFPDAALGRKLRVAGLGGETLQVMIPAGTQGGTALRLSGKGMPKVGGKGKGDLFVVVEVRTPTDLTERERALLQELAKLQKSPSPKDVPHHPKPDTQEG